VVHLEPSNKFVVLEIKLILTSHITKQEKKILLLLRIVGGVTLFINLYNTTYIPNDHIYN